MANAYEKVDIFRNNEVYSGLQSVYKEMKVDSKKDGLDVSLLSEINAAPPMFSDNTDPRLINISTNKSNYGRIYYRHFLRNAPLVFFEPGVPKFMPKSEGSWLFKNKKDEDVYNTVIKALASNDMSEIDGKAQDAFKALRESNEFRYDSRYYLFKSAFMEYSNYVNSMASLVSSRMGISDISKIRKSTPMMSSTAHARKSVGFYYSVDGSSYSESGSTSTGDSMIANIGSGASEMLREMRFIFNKDVSNDETRSSIASTFTERVNSMFPNGVTSFINNMMSYTKTVLKGGNLLFPEVWKDSQFSKSVSLTFKLCSPYGDPLSIFNHIYYPILSLCALALPRQISTQGYTSPFLVHCYSKGWFSIEMGMIESITIEKGGDGGWTKDGYPLEATVTVTIKDLYNELMLAAGNNSFILAKNTGLSEYLETMAGISPISHNYFQLDEKFNQFQQNLTQNITDILSHIEISDAALAAESLKEWTSELTGIASEMLEKFLNPDAVDDADYEEMPSGGDNDSSEIEGDTASPTSLIENARINKKPPKRPNVSPLSLKNKN